LVQCILIEDSSLRAHTRCAHRNVRSVPATHSPCQFFLYLESDCRFFSFSSIAWSFVVRRVPLGFFVPVQPLFNAGCRKCASALHLEQSCFEVTAKRSMEPSFLEPTHSLHMLAHISSSLDPRLFCLSDETLFKSVGPFELVPILKLSCVTRHRCWSVFSLSRLVVFWCRLLPSSLPGRIDEGLSPLFNEQLLVPRFIARAISSGTKPVSRFLATAIPKSERHGSFKVDAKFLPPPPPTPFPQSQFLALGVAEGLFQAGTAIRFFLARKAFVAPRQ